MSWCKQVQMRQGTKNPFGLNITIVILKTFIIKQVFFNETFSEKNKNQKFSLYLDIHKIYKVKEKY